MSGLAKGARRRPRYVRSVDEHFRGFRSQNLPTPLLSSCLRFRIQVCAQDRINPGLITRPLCFETIKYVLIDAKINTFFGLWQSKFSVCPKVFV